MKKILLLAFIAPISGLFAQTVSVDNPTPGEMSTYTFTYVTANTIGGESADEDLTLFAISDQDAFASVTPVFDSMDSLAAHVSVKIDGVDEPVTEDNFSAMLSGVSAFGVQLSLRSTGNFVSAGSEVEVTVSGVFQNTESAGNETLTWTTNKGTGAVVETFMNDATYGFSSLEQNAATDSNISLYPNPAQNFIYVSGIENVENYTIYNGAGIVVLNGTTTKNDAIAVAELSAGMYFIKVGNAEAIKFIKKD